MATKKAKPAQQKSARKKPQVAKASTAKSTPKKVVKTEKVTETKVEKTAIIASGKETKKGGYGAWIKGFFAKKYDANESILNIFSSPRIYGALLAEMFGVMLLTMFFMSFGALETLTQGGFNTVFQLNLQVMFVVMAVTVVIFGLSGANLNPIITAGMMATRRMSVIRGVLYMLVQVVGAWLGLLIISGFYAMGGEAASSSVSLPTQALWGDDMGRFWLFAILAVISAVILGFFFAQAQRHKRSAYTFAAVIGGSVLVAMMLVFAIQSIFFDYPATYNLASGVLMFNNPAIALMYQILPMSGANFGTLLGEVGMSLAVFVGFPALGSVCGFYFSDALSKLVDPDCCSIDCNCGCKVK